MINSSLVAEICFDIDWLIADVFVIYTCIGGFACINSTIFENAEVFQFERGICRYTYQIYKKFAIVNAKTLAIFGKPVNQKEGGGWRWSAKHMESGAGEESKQQIFVNVRNFNSLNFYYHHYYHYAKHIHSKKKLN